MNRQEPASPKWPALVSCSFTEDGWLRDVWELDTLPAEGITNSGRYLATLTPIDPLVRGLSG